MSTGRKEHWEKVHDAKGPEELSWFQETPTVTLQMLEAAGATAQTSIIDIGGGASRLVDHLIASGYSDVTVLDISSAALDCTRERLGADADRARWLAVDLLDADLPQRYDFWIDRAVYHFLTDPGDRSRYANQLCHALKPAGHALIATFAEDGPRKCSGLPCERYSPEALHAALGAEAFELVDSVREVHQTPAGQEQRFQYSLLRKKPVGA